MISVEVQYYALLREQARTSRERVTTTATTAQALYQELRARHQLTPDVSQLRVAIDGEFAARTDALRDGAEVVFIPPVAGG